MLLQDGDRVLDDVEADVELAGELGPDLGRRDGAGGAVEQPDTELLLQFPEPVAERGGRDPELDGRLRQTAPAHDGREDLQGSDAPALG